jgi:DeoR/GlpR family transcriptional regulator of sugar metabolism
MSLAVLPRNTHYVVVQLQDDPDIVDNSADIAGKHFNNTTLIQMDKGGGYRWIQHSFLSAQLQPFYQNQRLDCILL